MKGKGKKVMAQKDGKDGSQPKPGGKKKVTQDDESQKGGKKVMLQKDAKDGSQPKPGSKKKVTPQDNESQRGGKKVMPPKDGSKPKPGEKKKGETEKPTVNLSKVKTEAEDPNEKQKGQGKDTVNKRKAAAQKAKAGKATEN